MNKKGFTLIELLVVIAIIGVLASVVMISTVGVRKKAKAIKIMNDGKNIAIGFYSLKKQQELEGWWTEAEIGAGANPGIDKISGLETVMPKIPTPPIGGIDAYQYDNDEDILEENEASEKGVNILLTFSNDKERDEYFQLLDDLIEKGTGSSKGRIRTAPGSILVFNVDNNK